MGKCVNGLIALFPERFDYLATRPSGRLWVGTSANHVHFITLEGVPDQNRA